MAANNSPLAFTDSRNKVHIEPSVTGKIDVQTKDTPRIFVVNDLIALMAFRSGVPQTLNRLGSIAAVRRLHDPDGNNGLGVSLLANACDPFGDDGVNGAADFATVRVDTDATQAATTLVAGAVNVITIKTADYGSHTNHNTRKLTAGTARGKKLTLQNKNNTKKPFVGDNLGPILKVAYTGDASSATMDIHSDQVVIHYTGQPAEGDKITINGSVFEFTAAPVDPTDVAIGGSSDATFGSFLTAVTAVLGVAGVQDVGADNVTLTAVGITGGETLDSGNHFTVAQVAAALTTTLAGDQTDGSVDLNIPLGSAAYGKFSLLASYINSQNGYTASPFKDANTVLDSTVVDTQSAANIAAAGGATVTAYVAAIADFVNAGTENNYAATVLAYNLEPDVDLGAPVAFTGGSTPAVTTIEDYTAALELVGSQLDGGIIITDSTDVPLMVAIQDFCSEQEAKGKFFRPVFALDSNASVSRADRIDGFIQIASTIDNPDCTIVAERTGIFNSANQIEYRNTLYQAAAIAGGLAGNLPYVNPLTNKRLRIADVHPSDQWTEEERSQLLIGGITPIKREPSRRIVSLCVTTSQDPNKRMTRIRSEWDTIRLVGFNVIKAFEPYKGRWASVNVAALVPGTLGQVMNRFVSDGAIASGIDAEGQIIKAWGGMPIDEAGINNWVIIAGVLTLKYFFNIPGELNHVDARGAVEYTRLAGAVTMSHSI